MDNCRRLEFIDALRGYAILGVILVHSSMFVVPGAALQSIATRGAMGVQLFYIASALTLSLSWRFRHAKERAPLRNFFLRRFFRIAPLFYLALLFFLCVYGFAPRFWAPHGIRWWYVPLTFLFLNGFNPATINSLVPGGWSIAVESNFYAIFPFLMHRIRSLRSAVAFFVVSVFVFEAAKFVILHVVAREYGPTEQYLVDSFASQNIAAQMPAFAIGIFVSFFLDRIDSIKTALLWIDGLLVAATFLALGLPNRILMGLLGSYLAVLIIVGIVALSLAAFPVRLLVNRTIGFIGKISYSLYLTHYAVLYELARAGISARFGAGDWQWIGFFLFTTALSVLVSWSTYRIIEKPCIALGRRAIDALENAYSSGR